MARKKIVFFFTIILIFDFYVFPQTRSAQEIFVELEKQNQFFNGYYEGTLEMLFPYQKKNQFNFYFLIKDHQIYWELQKENQIHYKIICNQDLTIIYFYDKRRDELKELKEKDLVKNWNEIPYFMFCSIFLEKIIEPLRIENHKNDIFILGKFFFPDTKKTIRVHLNLDNQLIKYLIYNDSLLEYRILFYYDEPLLEEVKRNFQKVSVSFPVRWEILNASQNTVIIFKWNVYYRNYKIDDLRFKKEFISR